LPVNDVVPELHVLDDLGEPEHRGAGDPRWRERAGEQRGPTTDGQPALELDRVLDVRRIVRASRLLDVASDLVELTPDRFDVGVGQVGELLDVGDSHAKISVQN